MTTLTEPYSRAAALAEGRLRDVSHLNRQDRNPYPTSISAALWAICCRARPPRRLRVNPRRILPPCKTPDDRVRDVINLLPLFRWLERGRTGEFTLYDDSLHWLRHTLKVRVIVEPDAIHDRLVTILLEDERLDFRGPRPLHGGSFFAM